MPVAGTLIFIPHDLHYLLMWDRWFNVYDHWFMQLFFLGLIITNVMEFIFLYQLLKWGRAEILPKASQRNFVVIMLATQAAACIVWFGVKTVIADELWFFSFGWTIWFCLPFVIPLMLRRGSNVGQSTLMWSAYIGMALCWWITVFPLDPFFRSTAWIGLGFVIVVWAIVTIIFIRRLPSAETAKTVPQSSEETAI